MLLCWGDDHSLPASLLLGMLTFISSIRCNSSMNQAMFRETERAAKSPAAPIYSPVNFPPLSRSLMSSTSVSASPQHPSLSFTLTPFISFPLVLTRRCERRCMIYEALFLPVSEEKERREAATKREGEKEAEEWKGECEEQTQGEGGQEGVKETSITSRPLGLK